MIQKLGRTFYRLAAFAVTLSLIACVYQSSTSFEKTNLASNPLANPATHSVIQVDGSIAPNNVLQAAELDPNPLSQHHNAVLLTPAGAVSPKGDRIVKVVNRLVQNGSKEQSTVTVLDSNANPLVDRELQWLVGLVKFSRDGSQIIITNNYKW